MRMFAENLMNPGFIGFSANMQKNFEWRSSNHLVFRKYAKVMALFLKIPFKTLPVGTGGYQLVSAGTGRYWVPVGTGGYQWVPVGTDGYRT